jgi:hypothetical protein
MTVWRPLIPFFGGAALFVALATPSVGQDAADTAGARYEVIITNATRGQTFTPVFVATHRPGVRLFQIGSPANSELATVAEEGDLGPLITRAQSSPDIFDIATTGAPPAGFVRPGESKTVIVRTRGVFDHLTIVAMLIPTNDAFVALNDVAGPNGQRVLEITAPAYDAGSERNDELCASIPGPFFAECGGPGGGGQPTGGEEGYVHVHAGIHGIGDLVASERDWPSTTASIPARRTKCSPTMAASSWNARKARWGLDATRRKQTFWPSIWRTTSSRASAASRMRESSTPTR